MPNKPSPLQPQWQNKAWKQFLMAKKDMLHAYDRAKEKGLERSVRTEHGRVAEAEFRKWLTNFLPKKYGVTSGYIISQGMPKDEYLVHYDVIIYEHLEAPILWIDDNPDHSEQGKSMAIPVEYVRGVIEVKSRFSKKTAADAISQLAKLKPLLQKIDPPQHPTKLYLPKEFFCAAVFFELRKEHEKEFAALDAVLEGTGLRGFYGGFILRCETLDEHYGGKLSIVQETESYGHDNTSLSFWSYSKSKKLRENLYCRILLTHCESFFSQFAFDIIALLKGTYHPGVISSLYGFGTTDMYNGKAVSIQYYNIEEHKRYEETTREYMEDWFKSVLGEEK
ncbi:MAG: hypothetical protein DI588_14620 [Flavobacterium johnsoniae]|nr:MAG: hypothetical protein DI588_14620 [Flavobacterium johnsoniae]